jgi:uridylate kinase
MGKDSSFVLKVGGSLLYDEKLMLNKEFLFKLLKWYEKAKDKYDHIVITTGGGKISRHFTNQLKEVVPAEKGLHSVGMATTNLNALIIKAFLQDDDIYVPNTLGDALDRILTGDKNVIISGGHKVGWSTDMDAAVFADVLGDDKFHKLSNVDYIYTADPNTYPSAIPIKDMNWAEYMSNFGMEIGVTEHKPGQSLPIGAFATQFCAQKGISVHLGGGDNLLSDNGVGLEESLIQGTLVHP